MGVLLGLEFFFSEAWAPTRCRTRDPGRVAWSGGQEAILGEVVAQCVSLGNQGAAKMNPFPFSSCRSIVVALPLRVAFAGLRAAPGGLAPLELASLIPPRSTRPQSSTESFDEPDTRTDGGPQR
jgi:hypothetical protein